MFLKHHNFSTPVEKEELGKRERESSTRPQVREARILAGMRVSGATLAGVLKPARFDRKIARGYTARFLFRGLTQNEQAHFSAEQPPSQAHARLSGPHAHQGRSGGSLAPAPQGAQAPRRLGVQQARSEGLPKEKRLAKRREFLHVYETGRKWFSRYCVVFAAPNQRPFSRIVITATKKLGKAAVR